MDNWGKLYAGRKLMPQAIEKLNSSIKDLKPYFTWFDAEFSNIIKEICASYWNISPEVRLFSLEKNSNNFSQGNNYFVTGIQIKELKYTFRLSDSACERFLTKTLGKNENNSFAFKNMTELEGSIISKFNNLIFNGIKPLILSPKEIQKKLEQEYSFGGIVSLGFIIYEHLDDEEFEMGKLFINLPEKVFNFPDIPSTEEIIDVTKFRKAQTLVDIFVGKTKLSLNDINNLETEDIVVLDDSNIKQMAISYPTEFAFNVNPDPRLFIKEDDDTEFDEQEENIEMSTKNIWDNVQVDVCAKFPKVKMSLGELRDMSEGIVMELDSIYGNEITLEVENKNVAKGELVIIGYKYGVKITEIFSQSEDIEEKTQSTANDNNDDFDVNDFEIEE